MPFTCDDIDDYDESEACACPRCMGMCSINCYCGGDQCYCDNQGDMDCPTCEARGEVSEKVYEAYLKREREMMAAFHGWPAGGTPAAPAVDQLTSEPIDFSEKPNE